MLVVSDTSPISSLLQINRVELLRDLFESVCTPPAVRIELERFHSALPAFLELRTVADHDRVASLLPLLDAGEAEAIVLASECGADYLLIDERRGRAIALQQGVRTIGLLGVILLAKQRQLITSVKDCVIELQSKAGFYVSHTLVQKILAAASE
jgi:uncharacterized protein